MEKTELWGFKPWQSIGDHSVVNNSFLKISVNAYGTLNLQFCSDFFVASGERI